MIEFINTPQALHLLLWCISGGTYDLPDLINRMEVKMAPNDNPCDQIVDTGGGYNKPIPAEISSYTLTLLTISLPRLQIKNS